MSAARQANLIVLVNDAWEHEACDDPNTRAHKTCLAHQPDECHIQRSHDCRRQARTIRAALLASAAFTCARSRLKRGLGPANPRLRAARWVTNLRVAGVSQCSRPQQVHTSGWCTMPCASKSGKTRAHALRFLTRARSVPSPPALMASGDATHTSSAESWLPEAAPVRMSAGRRLGRLREDSELQVRRLGRRS